eukprot:24880-Pelagococcus_subviridis.AAC.2
MPRSNPSTWCLFSSDMCSVSRCRSFGLCFARRSLASASLAAFSALSRPFSSRLANASRYSAGSNRVSGKLFATLYASECRGGVER